MTRVRGRGASSTLSAALRYRALGCSVVPAIPRTKKPLARWKDFQRRRPDVEEIRAWYQREPAAGVIIVCGRVSGIAVVDIDPRNGGDLHLADRLPGPRCETPSGGVHVYLAIDSTIPKLPGIFAGVDLQGEGAYAVAPPSIHPNGARYRWAPGHALGEVSLAAVPAWLRRRVRERAPRPTARPDEKIAEHLPPDIAGVLGRLQAVRGVAGGWIARCPAHEDRQPSLSIGIGHDGKVLFHCFAGCAFAGIVAALDRVRT